MKEEALLNDGGSTSHVGSQTKEISHPKRRSVLASPGGSMRDFNKPKDGPYVMNLSLIGKTRQEKAARAIAEENKELEESVKPRDRSFHPSGVKSMVLQPTNSIDHSLFLEARVRNLNEALEALGTQIQQENNALESLKVRRRRVKALIMSMLTKLLRHPVESL